MIFIANGTIVETLRDMPDNTVDGVLCDPPYGLAFMGKKWDYELPSAETWEAIYRVCKPGAYLLAYGGARTYHRAVCAIEDAGFEIRDCLTWLYGMAMPKSQNISIALDKAAGLIGHRGRRTNVASNSQNASLDSGKAVEGHVPLSDAAKTWQGYGTGLKPAWEPITLARKPLIGTMAEQVTEWGTGALNIEATRVGTHTMTQEQWTRLRSTRCQAAACGTHKPSNTKVPSGRWPANLILDETAGALLDEQAGVRPGMSGGGKHKAGYPGGMFGGIDSTGTARGDTGGASRFFYSAKVNKRERNAGCEHLTPLAVGKDANHHPTLKPIDLNRYLATLIKQPGQGTLLVPFSGAGSEVIGAALAGWANILGIEADPNYVEIANARIVHWVP